jgi:predicted membrane metal-binding protein
MENIEKARVLQSAVNVAEANGFDFLAWYQGQLNIIPSGKMHINTRIAHICSLGIENVLVFSHAFLQALIKEGWEKFAQEWVLKKCPVISLSCYLVEKGILNE